MMTTDRTIDLIRELTPAQERVAQLVGRGLSYGAIAAALGISRHTVRAHIRAIANRMTNYEPDRSYYNTVLLWAATRARDTH